MKLIANLQNASARLKNEIAVLYLAARDPRVPWYAKAVLIGVVGYALSPIDLIPDPIPILGYIDDLLLLPLGLYVALKMIPESVLADCRQRALAGGEKLPKSWFAAIVIVALWILSVALIARYLLRFSYSG